MHRNEKGFTLLELLVTLLIIAILAAIAVPLFLRHRQRGWEAQMRSSLKSAANAVESFAVDAGGSYAGVDSQDNADYLTKLEGEGFQMPTYLDLLTVESDSANYFCIEARHRSLPIGNGWRRSVYMSTSGAPAPTPNRCPRSLF